MVLLFSSIQVFITEHFTYFVNNYLFYLFFCCCKNNAVQYRSLRWIKSHEEIELWRRRYESTYEWEKLEFTPLYKRICERKVVQIAPRSTYEKSGCWITIWQYWSRSYVRLSLKVRSLYETYSWGYTWCPLTCYPFINIKLASYHLLLYVDYLCQKS